MKIRISQNALAPVVAQAARYVAARPVTPELGALVLETFTNGGESYLRITGYDGDATSKAAVAVEIIEPGKVLIPGVLFADIVRDLPKGTVTIESVVNESDNELSKVKISAGRGNYSLTGYPEENYPELPVMTAEAGRIDAALFSSAVSQVARAASKDHEPLTCVRVIISEESMTLMATDRYRIARRTIPWTGSETTGTAFLTAKALASSASQFSKGGELRVAFQGSSKGTFTLANETSAVIMNQKDDKSFPAEKSLNGLFEGEVTHVAEGSIAEISAASKRIAKLTSNESKPLRYAFSENLLTISVAQETTDGSEEVEIEYEGEEFEIFFNPTFFLDGLSALGTENVIFNFRGVRKPAAMKAKGGTGDFTYLVVPIDPAKAVQ